MKDFEHAYDVLLKVVEEGLPFNVAINSSLKKAKDLTANLKSSVSFSAAVVLRHYYVFKEIFKRKYEEEKENKFLLFALALGNRLFSKRFNEDELLAYVEKETQLDGIVDLVNQYDDPRNLVPSDIEQNSDLFLSLRYNIPVWIVRMWRKNIGPKAVRKVLRNIYLPNHFVSINTNQIDVPSFYEKYNDFEPFEVTHKVAVFKGTNQLRKNPAVINNDALMIPAIYGELLSELDIDFLRGVAIYAATPNQLLEQLYVTYGKNMKLDYICGDQKAYFDIDKKLKHFGFNNVSAYECSASSLITCISKPVHTLFVCPKNSNFALFSEKPDFFLTIKQEDLDEFIKNEYDSLIEACSQVEDGGELVYFVPTYCKNESQTVIRRFLEAAPSFTLVKQRQVLPFSNYQTLFYYAVLKKELKND